jgi:hypothetical protein
LGGARLPGSCRHLKWRLLAALPPLEKAVGVFGFFFFLFGYFVFLVILSFLNTINAKYEET